MPFSRPTLTQLKAQVASDIASQVPGADALLRFSNLGVIGRVLAGLANALYGYLDWIARQAVPYTATGVFLEAWAALKAVIRKAALPSSGSATFTGTPTTPIPSGTSIVRGDGALFLSTADAVVSGGGSAVVAVEAVAPGAAGNTAVGVVLTLSQAIAGVASAGSVSAELVGGEDLESDDDLRSRMLQVYAAPPAGGDREDYITWARAEPNVTRAWVAPNGFGLGSVVVYIMLDVLRAGTGGFPTGTDGVAELEPRGSTATGDQLDVADAIFAVQPALALVYVVAPIASAQAFTLAGVPLAYRAEAEAALAEVFTQDGAPGDVYTRDGSDSGVVRLARCWSAIAARTGLTAFSIEAPTVDITVTTGHIATVGVVSYL